MTIGRILTHINLGIASTRRRDTEKRVCTFEESVEFYRFNLKLRRYLHDETSIKTDLSDQDSGDSMNDDTSFNQDDFVSSLYDTKNIDESIWTHIALEQLSQTSILQSPRVLSRCIVRRSLRIGNSFALHGDIWEGLRGELTIHHWFPVPRQRMTYGLIKTNWNWRYRAPKWNRRGMGGSW